MERLLDIDVPPEGTEEFNYLIECCCGCGSALWKFDRQGKDHYYLKGHNRKLGGSTASLGAREGRIVDKSGYVRVLVKIGGKYKYLREHRMIVEEDLGRNIEKGHYVHHIDENKTNNALENLFLTTHGVHMKIHKRIRRIKKLRGVEVLSIREYEFCLTLDNFLPYFLRLWLREKSPIRV